MLKDYKGACHIHTEYSDGSILVSDVIKSAQDASLDFVILSDNNTFFGEQRPPARQSVGWVSLLKKISLSPFSFPARVRYHFFLLLLVCNLTKIILIFVMSTRFHTTQI
jgi:hypothetical protein